MKIKLILIGLSAVLSVIAMTSGLAYLNSQQDYSRIKKAYSDAKMDLEYYQNEKGLLVAKAKALQLQNNELRLIYPQILSEIQNLKLKASKVNHYTKTVVRQEKQILKELRDSIIYDTLKVKVFDYADSFYKVDGILLRDSIRMNIHSQDTLIQVVYRGKRPKPWLWFFSRRQLEQVISCKNPNATILYSKHIQIAK
jgi:predicted nuclease with TOPRIM domain